MADSKSSTDSKSDTIPESQTSADIKSDTVAESQTSTESKSITALGSQTSTESKSNPVHCSSTSSEERKPIITSEPTSQTSSGSNEGVSGTSSSASHAPIPRSNPISSIASTGSPPNIDRSEEIERLGSVSVSPTLVLPTSASDSSDSQDKDSKWRALYRYAKEDLKLIVFSTTFCLVACISLALLYLNDKWIAFQYACSIFGGIILGILTICGCGINRFKKLQPNTVYMPVRTTAEYKVDTGEVKYKSHARSAVYDSPPLSQQGTDSSSTSDVIKQPKVTGSDAQTFVTSAEITPTDISETDETDEEPVRQRHLTSDEEVEQQQSINV